jgi:hypothetical protein
MNGSPPGTYFTPEEEMLPRESVVSEKLILTLPSSAEVLGADDSLLQSWFNWGTFRVLLDTNERKRWTEMMMRLIRSLLLLAKVMTLRGMCPDPSTGPRPIVAAFLLALAVGDTVLDHHDLHVQVRRRRSKSRNEDKIPERTQSPMLRLLSRFGSRIWITVGLTILHFALISLSSSSNGEGFLERSQWCGGGLAACLWIDRFEIDHLRLRPTFESRL